MAVCFACVLGLGGEVLGVDDGLETAFLAALTGVLPGEVLDLAGFPTTVLEAGALREARVGDALGEAFPTGAFLLLEACLAGIAFFETGALLAMGYSW